MWLSALAQVNVQTGNANDISAALFALIRREAQKETSINDCQSGPWLAAGPAANPVWLRQLQTRNTNKTFPIPFNNQT